MSKIELGQFSVGIFMPHHMTDDAHEIETSGEFRAAFIEHLQSVLALPTSRSDGEPTPLFALEDVPTSPLGTGPFWTSETEQRFVELVQAKLQAAADLEAEACDEPAAEIEVGQNLFAGCSPGPTDWISSRTYGLGKNGQPWACEKVVEIYEASHGPIPEPIRSLLAGMPVCVMYTFETDLDVDGAGG